MKSNKKILLVGAGGYLGTKMTNHFLQKGYDITVLDRFFFGNTLDDIKSSHLHIVKDDIRSFDKQILKGIDSIINLASISNDPASELLPEMTQEINMQGAIRLAKLAKEMHVKNIFLLLPVVCMEWD